ncbi:MAG TPA: ornithine cyclodeaminase family protein [Methylomirabilota bacterium]|jgi:ornithine cyclodeaminase/alanine dehydrogenase-like protein (mu-crystallin family)
MLVLGHQDLTALLAPGDVIAAVERAFRECAAGRVAALPRAGLPMGRDGVFLAMISALPALRALGTKLATVVEGNRRRGLPTIQATYLLTDPETGTPLALMEAAFLTAIRTGAASAVAARHLARPESRVIACFGAGVQARYQLLCLREVLPLVEVRVVGRGPVRAAKFVRQMRRELGIPVELTTDRRAAVQGADVVTCATTSPRPVFSGRDLGPGTHVDAVGNFRPTTREVDTVTVRKSRVVVDTYEGAWEEAGDLLLPIKAGAITRRHVRAELAEVVVGSRPGRTSAREITLFKSVGFAPEDAVAARLAYDRALEAGRGVRVDL